MKNRYFKIWTKLTELRYQFIKEMFTAAVVGLKNISISFSKLINV